MTDQQQLARGKNVMLSLLEKRLSVPRIYFDVNWQGEDVDLLAIDRDGSGDVHAVMAYVRPLLDGQLPDTIADKKSITEKIEQLSKVRTQYKYALGVGTTTDWRAFGDHPAPELIDESFSPDGLGRVGVAFAGPDQTGMMIVNLSIFPERFRAFVSQAADDFVKTHSADWEVRA